MKKNELLKVKICSLSGIVTIKLDMSCQVLTSDLNQVLSVSLVMTASAALANDGLFELPLCTFVDTGRLVVICGNY